MKIAMVAALCIAAVAALFAVQNAQHTQVSFLAWYFEAPLVMLLLLTFAAGAAAGFLVTLPSGFRKTLEIKRLKSKLQALPPAETIPAAPPETKPTLPPSAGSEPAAKL